MLAELWLASIGLRMLAWQCQDAAYSPLQQRYSQSADTVSKYLLYLVQHVLKISH